MKKYWKTRDKKFLNDILNLTKTKYFVHPTDTDWMHDIIIDWATDKKNKIKLLKGTSAIVVPHSH